RRGRDVRAVPARARACAEGHDVRHAVAVRRARQERQADPLPSHRGLLARHRPSDRLREGELRLRRGVPVIGAKKVLAVVPARGGSKGLPGKNILPVQGRPLLAWTADAARAARLLDRVVVSPHADAILAAAHACGVEALRRPAELATDTATTIDVVLHA